MRKCIKNSKSNNCILFLSELKNSAVSVTAPSSITSSPMVLMVLILSIGFNLIAGAQAARTLIPEQRMDHLVTQFIEAQDMEGLGGLAAVGLAGLFEQDGGVRRRKINGKKETTESNVFQPSQELYAYSDLPRLF